MLGLGGYIRGLRPRETEGTDTRLMIARRPADQDSRRPARAREEESLAEDDTARVSVEALISFFESLLLGDLDQAQKSPSLIADEAASQENAQSPYAARAAQAYSQTARNHDLRYGAHPRDQHKEEKEGAPVAAQEKLSAEDFAVLWDLRARAIALQSSGVSFVTIARGPSFLESLRAAIDDAAAP